MLSYYNNWFLKDFNNKNLKDYSQINNLTGFSKFRKPKNYNSVSISLKHSEQLFEIIITYFTDKYFICNK